MDPISVDLIEENETFRQHLISSEDNYEVLVFSTNLINQKNERTLGPLSHWVSIFTSGDKSIIIDAYNRNGNLTGRFCKNPLIEKEIECINLGTIRTSSLSLFVQGLKCNIADEKYELLNKNCQTWLLRFLESLDIDTGKLKEVSIVEDNITKSVKESSITKTIRVVKDIKESLTISIYALKLSLIILKKVFLSKRLTCVKKYISGGKIITNLRKKNINYFSSILRKRIL